MKIRAFFAAIALVTSAACGNEETSAADAVAQADSTEPNAPELWKDDPRSSRAARVSARPPSSDPPGYRPPELVPFWYLAIPPISLSPVEELTAFKQMERTHIGQTAKRGERVSPLPVAAKQLAPTVSWRGKSYTDVEAFMRDALLSGVLVLKDGEIALEHYAFGRTAQDRWTSFSVAKSVTALLLGAALQDGSIRSLDEPVTRYIPELAKSAYDGVTIRQLITMTSGVKWREDYESLNSDVVWSAIWPREGGMNPMVSYVRHLGRAAEPGTLFNYNTGETDLAGILVANATGRGLAQYLSETIWAPFGMEQDAFWMVDTGSMERGGCCISMTLRDYGRIGLFVLGGGMAGGKRVIPESYLKQATSNQLRQTAQDKYGYFWWIDGEDTYSARGIFGQTIWIAPAEKLVLVTNGAWAAAKDPAGIEAVEALFTAVRGAFH